MVTQRGEGLGARLAAGFDDLGPGVIVGMDTPGGLPHLAAMVDAVASGIDSIGLTVDGGYWAIGLAAPEASGGFAAVFEDVPMSTGRTGIVQLRRLHALGRRARLAPMVHDVDRIEDVARVVGEAPHGRLADLVTCSSCRRLIRRRESSRCAAGDGSTRLLRGACGRPAAVRSRSTDAERRIVAVGHPIERRQQRHRRDLERHDRAGQQQIGVHAVVAHGRPEAAPERAVGGDRQLARDVLGAGDDPHRRLVGAAAPHDRSDEVVLRGHAERCDELAQRIE